MNTILKELDTGNVFVTQIRGNRVLKILPKQFGEDKLEKEKKQVFIDEDFVS